MAVSWDGSDLLCGGRFLGSGKKDGDESYQPMIFQGISKNIRKVVLNLN
jgi:hypothetical protein